MDAEILVAEDESAIREGLCALLESEGYTVRAAVDGEDALRLFGECRPDLVLLDVMMPGEDGFSLGGDLIAQGVPVLFVTAKTAVCDRVRGLRMGAQDYILKPFEPAELLARVRVALRHTRSGPGSGAIANTGKFTAGELTIDYDKHQVLIAGENCRLTQNEYKIVALLGKCAGKVLTYDFIMKELWGPQSRGNNQILRVNMANIRRKIEKNPAEPQYIFTEVGVGYRMIEGD